MPLLRHAYLLPKDAAYHLPLDKSTFFVVIFFTTETRMRFASDRER
jgi:hypothetical protein